MYDDIYISYRANFHIIEKSQQTAIWLLYIYFSWLLYKKRLASSDSHHTTEEKIYNLYFFIFLMDGLEVSAKNECNIIV